MISTSAFIFATVALNALSSFAAPIRVTRRGSVAAAPEVESIGRRQPQPIAADTVVVPRAEPVAPAPALSRRFPRRVYYEHYSREASKAPEVVAREAGSSSSEAVQARAPEKEASVAPAAKRGLVRKRASERPVGSVKKRSVKKRSTNKKRSTKSTSVKKRSVKKRSTKKATALKKRSPAPAAAPSIAPIAISKRSTRLTARSNTPRARSIKNRSTPATVNLDARHHENKQHKRTSYTIINIHHDHEPVDTPKTPCGATVPDCPLTCNKAPSGNPPPPVGTGVPVVTPPTGTNGTTTDPSALPVPVGAPGTPVPIPGSPLPVTTEVPPIKGTSSSAGLPPPVPTGTTGTGVVPPPPPPVGQAAKTRLPDPSSTVVPPGPLKKGKLDPNGTGSPPVTPPVQRRRVVTKRAPKISPAPSKRMSRRNVKRNL